MRRFRLVMGILLAAVPLLAAAGTELEQARKLYSYTDFNGSLDLLLRVQNKTPETLELIGRNYYMLGEYRRSTDYLEKALQAEPSSSSHAMWLGRAYGRRAETSNLLTAPRYASRTREYFERAVALDPNNLEALNDLFEYYLEAPGFLGGGYEKAAAMAQRIGHIDAVEGHWAQAKLAEKRKEYGAAEEQLRRAAQLAPQQVSRLIDLAKFLAKQGRVQESDQSFQQAAKLAPNHPKLLFERAETYIKQGRNLKDARDLLQRYLSTTTLTPDDPPRADAERLLRQAGG